MRTRPSIAATGAALLLLCLAAAPARAQVELVTLPIALTVAEESGEPVVDDAWIQTQLDNTNRLYTPHGIRFVIASRESMPERHARLERRRDRHALGALMHEDVIDWFVVRSLRDVDDPSRYRQGVHWRPRGDDYPERAHFVITSSIAGPHVLAHELGHFFGNGHSDTPGNIMSYTSAEGPPFFDGTQVRRVRFSLRRFLSRGQLVARE